LLLARGALQSPPVVGAGFEGRIVELMPAAQPSSDGAAYAADGADGDSETSPSPTPAPSPTPLPVQGSGTVITPPSGQTDTETGTPAAAASFAGQATAMGTNYALASVQGDAGSIEFTLDGAPAAATAVLADGSLLKVELPAGSAGGMLNATLDGAVLMAQNLSFGGASAAAPKTLYGTAPMAFSEFFHDITAGIDTVRPDVTAFDAGGAAAAPALFITQGTRAGDLPYAQGDLLAKVDAVSSATYGDTVHYVPTGNLDVTNPGDARFSHGDGNAITGITRVEVGVPFDLYANAELLAAAGRETERSAAVLAACGKVTANSAELADGSFADAGGAAIDAPLVYKPKYLLPDGGWGKRAEEALNGGAVVAKPLPGDGSSDMEDVAYGGNWGDKVTGVSFGTLQAEYAGANYWDNFAEYLYAGYIEDSAGHKEPLVFLQNIFSHRMHEDFDIAISPSRFSRLGRLDAPGTYTAHVYAWGFEDVTAAFEVKGYANAGAAIVGGATVAAAAGGEAQTLTITGVDGIDGYDPAALRLYKGSDEVAGAKYSAAKEGGEVKLTLGTALFDGAFQGAYTIRLVPDTDGVVSKALTFTAVKLIERPLLTAASDLSGGAGATEDAPLAVAKSAGRLYFTDSEFAAALVTSGRSGYTSIQAAGGASPAAAIGSAAAREAAGEPYWLDLAADAFAIGETYIIVANATGFQPQTYYVTVLGEEEDAPPPELPGDAEG
jgi:hypothetical protein